MQPLADRPRGRFARPRRRLRAGLVQLLCALAGLGLGLLLPRITLDVHGGQHPGDGRAGRGGLRRPGAGDRHLLAAVPGRAVGLHQPVAPAEPVPRRPDRVADIRLCRRGVRVLGHHRPGHRRPAESVGDRAGRRGGGGARRPRPDPDPAGRKRSPPSSWRPRWRPSPGRAAASSTTCTPGRARQTGNRPPRCRRGAGRSSGRTARRSCSNSTWAGCCAPPAAP